MLNVKFIISSVLSLSSLFILASSGVAQEKIIAQNQVNFVAPNVLGNPIPLEAAPLSLSKEVYEIMIQESSEAALESITSGVYYKNEALKKYQNILNDVCALFPNKKCPELYFSKREVIPGSKPQTAAMLPIGLLALSEEALQSLDTNQAIFIVSHEYAHYHYGHSLKRINAASKSVWDHGIMITEPEKIFMVIPMLPGMRDFLQNVEQEADDFALAYLKFRGLEFDCKSMYKTLLGGRVESTDKHKSVDERCAHTH